MNEPSNSPNQKLHHHNDRLTRQILIALIAGTIVGLLFRFFPSSSIHLHIIKYLFDPLGTIFIKLLQMLVAPIVLISLICGTINLGSSKSLGRLSSKTIALYLTTTVIAVIIGLSLASVLNIGHNAHLTVPTSPEAVTTASISLKQTLVNLVPSNVISALATGNMLQIIVFALLFGIALAHSQKGEKLIEVLQSANEVLMDLILLIMKIAPYAVFCLIAKLFADLGFAVIKQLLFYFLTVIAALLIQLVVTYGALLLLFTGKNPVSFVKKIIPAILFAFSTSSSNATIPITLETLIHKLKVKPSIAAFTVPLGATINMDGTAIMQGVATIFIAHAYNIPLSTGTLISVVITAVLASVGTAGVPGVGLIMLAMIFKQAGLPLAGIALILGVDRLLDMTRTAVNICGDCVVSYIVGRSEQRLENRKNRSQLLV